MHGRIELLGTYHDVAVYGRVPDQVVQIDETLPLAAVLVHMDSGECEIQLGRQRTRARMHIKGETAYIRAFRQAFKLKVVHPVEQARSETGTSSRKARAPMPGVVVDILVAEGNSIVKGQVMMTIESMKILTAIRAPSEAKVEKIHFSAGQPFDKGAVLVTLSLGDK